MVKALPQVDDRSRPPARAAWAVLLLFATAALVAALLAPPVFNFLVGLGRRFPALESLRNLEFERVASRLALLSVVLLLLPVARWSGIRCWAQVGFGRDDAAWTRVGRAFGVGLALSAGLYVAGWLLGVFRWAPNSADGLSRMLLYLPGALLVAVIEECLFRGLLFGSFRRSLGFLGAVLLSSALYAAIHFAKPVPGRPVLHGHGDSGFRILADLFPLDGTLMHYFPISLTLFTLGVGWCLLFAADKNLYRVIGLHAGLVYGMRTGVYVLERARERPSWLYGSSAYVSKSYAALAAAVALCVVCGYLLVRRRGPPAS